MTKKQIKHRICYFHLTAAFLAEENENETCLRYLFLVEYYKDLLEE